MSKPKPPQSLRTSLARIRPPNEVADDLDFFFARAASEIGIGSNFGPLVNLAMCGVGGAHGRWVDPMSTERIEAIGRWRDVAGYLAQMPRSHVEVLEVAYEPQQLLPQAAHVFGPFGAVVELTEPAREAHQADLEARARRRGRGRNPTIAETVNDLAGGQSARARALRDQMASQAIQLLTDAWWAFAWVRDGVRRELAGARVARQAARAAGRAA